MTNTMRIWIDVSTGTYGSVEDLRIVDIDTETLETMDYGQLSDEDIAEIGRVNGKAID